MVQEQQTKEFYKSQTEIHQLLIEIIPEYHRNKNNLGIVDFSKLILSFQHDT